MVGAKYLHFRKVHIAMDADVSLNLHIHMHFLKENWACEIIMMCVCLFVYVSIATFKPTD